MPCLEVTGATEVSPLKRTKPYAVAENVISVLKFSKLSEHATAPTRGSAKAAGYDLFRWVTVRDSGALEVICTLYILLACIYLASLLVTLASYLNSKRCVECTLHVALVMIGWEAS
uniref:Uncharacterized protein n=1 Tax=Hucho hucho TaxID=62062 RepID=A0A4W5LKE0_9TELE